MNFLEKIISREKIKALIQINIYLIIYKNLLL